MSSYVQNLRDAILSLAKVRDTAVRALMAHLASYFLANGARNKRAFNAEVKEACEEITPGAYSNARTYLSKIWASLEYFGEGLATVWIRGEGPSMENAYSRVPKSAPNRKTEVQKVFTMLVKLSDDDLETVIGKCAEIAESRENAKISAQDHNEKIAATLAEMLAVK